MRGPFCSSGRSSASFKHSVVVGCVCVALLGAALGARAQTGAGAAAASGSLEEIVVTAQRRAQNIQNVPISISAFTSSTLQQQQHHPGHSARKPESRRQLDAGAPFSGDRSVLSASIRGIGQDDFAMNLNPGVGVYLDGVYLARTIGANVNLLDVDRVEILKGPQGTLFGANTIGGAISIVTHTPGNDLRMTAEVTGGEYNRRDVPSPRTCR